MLPLSKRKRGGISAMDSISAFIGDVDFWRNAAAGLGIIATAIVSIGIIYSRFFSPFLARPLASALRKELGEEVLIIIGSDEVQHVIQETVSSEMGVVIDHLMDVSERLEVVEVRTAAILRRGQNVRSGDE